MAIFGWIDIKEAEIYTRAADRKRLASRAMGKLEREQPIFPPIRRWEHSGQKPLQYQLPVCEVVRSERAEPNIKTLS